MFLWSWSRKDSKRDKTFNCPAAFFQIVKTCNWKFKWSSISIPKSFTLFEVSVELPLILKPCGLILPLLLSIIIDWNLTGFTITYYHGFTVSNALTWVFTHIKDILFFFRFILKPCYSHLNEVTTICSFQKTYKLNWQIILLNK